MSYDPVEELLSWTWAGANPDQWLIQNSVNGLTEFEDVNSIPGANRSLTTPADDMFYRIIGLDTVSDEVTGWSNVVQATA